VNLGFQASKRREAMKFKASDAKHAPHFGMVQFKGAWAWCKKCAGSKKGGDSHSRIGDANEDYANCQFYGSIARLSKVKKRELQLVKSIGGIGAEAAHELDAPRAPAAKVARTEFSGTGSCAVRAARARSFVVCGAVVCEVLDEVCKTVEGRVLSEAHRVETGLKQPVVPASHGRDQRPPHSLLNGIEPRLQTGDDSAADEDPAVAKLLHRAKKLPVCIAEALRHQRQQQRDGAAPWGSQLHFELTLEPETVFIDVDGSRFEVVIRPSREERLCQGRRFYMIDLDTRLRFMAPGGLFCFRCGSFDLIVRQMSHTMQDRGGVRPVVRADGMCDWISGKGRTCRACKAAGRKCTMFDHEGPMIAQMTENVQLQLPASPNQSYGEVYIARCLEKAIDANVVHYQGGATVAATTRIVAAQQHDERGLAYDALNAAYLTDLHKYASNEVWTRASSAWKIAFKSLRCELLDAREARQRGESIFEQWPKFEDTAVVLSDSVIRNRRIMMHEARRETQRQSLFSVGGIRASNDNTFHVAHKMSFSALNVTTVDTKEIATLQMLRTHGKFEEYEPTLQEFFERPNVNLLAVYTDDAPNNKAKIEAMAGAPLRGDKAHTQRRLTSVLNHYGAAYSFTCHGIKCAFSTPRGTTVELVDSLLLAGKIRVQLGERKSMGLGAEGDKFSIAEIAAAKAVVFDEHTLEKSGGEYWNKFASSKKGKSNIPMDTREPGIIAQMVRDVLKETQHLEAERNTNQLIVKKKKVSCLSAAFVHAVALNADSARQLERVGDPWVEKCRDKRCVTGELKEYNCTDGSGYTEANNLVLDHGIVSNYVGPALGYGLLVDCIEPSLFFKLKNIFKIFSKMQARACRTRSTAVAPSARATSATTTANSRCAATRSAGWSTARTYTRNCRSSRSTSPMR
jgi:hypothetical protein